MNFLMLCLLVIDLVVLWAIWNLTHAIATINDTTRIHNEMIAELQERL